MNRSAFTDEEFQMSRKRSSGWSDVALLWLLVILLAPPAAITARSYGWLKALMCFTIIGGAVWWFK